jgi:predicted cupin superfamily sugar epimerase
MSSLTGYGAEYYIQHLHLERHPEGGYFKESYRSSLEIGIEALPATFNGSRRVSTAIYYLLQSGDFSAFHRIKSDECWHFYAGETLLIHVINIGGAYHCCRLGSKPDRRETMQYVVPAGAWFAAEPASNSAYSLVGCTVAPGFDFNDFELAQQQKLVAQFPAHADLITRLCR